MIDSLITSAPLIWKGLFVTLEVSALVLSIGTCIGILGGLLLLYGVRPLRWLIRLYVDTIRGVPLLVLIFAIFSGFPVLLEVRLNALTAGIASLSVFCGAHVSEVIRGGID